MGFNLPARRRTRRRARVELVDESDEMRRRDSDGFITGGGEPEVGGLSICGMGSGGREGEMRA